MPLDFATTGDRVTVPSITIALQISITAWARNHRLDGTNTAPRILDHGDLRLFIGTGPLLTFQRVFANGVTAEWTVPVGSIDWTKWHHIAVVHDSSALGQPTIYIDDVAQTVTTSTAPTVAGGRQVSGTLVIGNRGAQGRQFGELAWVGIYNALRPQGIVANHARRHGIHPLYVSAAWQLLRSDPTHFDVAGYGSIATQVGSPLTVADGPPMAANLLGAPWRTGSTAAAPAIGPQASAEGDIDADLDVSTWSNLSFEMGIDGDATAEASGSVGAEPTPSTPFGLRSVRPPRETFAEQLYDTIGPLKDEDDGSVDALTGAIGRMFQEVEDLVRDEDEGPGWSVALDVNRAPDAYLPWLAQLVGVRIPPKVAGDAAWIYSRQAAGFRRGTPDAIRAAAEATLNGTRQVILRERNGSPYRLTVVTRESETPDPAATRAAILAQKPGGLVLTHLIFEGQTWEQVVSEYADWGDVVAAYATWADLVTDNPF